MYGSKKEELLHFHYITILAPIEWPEPQTQGLWILEFR